MCDHCGCRQGAIGRLMDQHEQITRLADDVRRLIRAGDEPAARTAFARLAGVLDWHTGWEERGLFARMVAQGDFAEHVAALEAEHVTIHDAATAADTAPGGWSHAIEELLDHLDTHIYRENFGLFPGAISVLDADDWEAIEASEAGVAAALSEN